MSIAANEMSCFVPLESNPESLNRLLSSMGFLVNQYRFVDMYSLSDRVLLGMIPRPVLGLLLVLPSSTAAASNSDGEKKAMTDDRSHGAVWHTRQTIGGACASHAVLHLVANLPRELRRPSSWLDRFLTNEQHQEPQGRALLLASDPEYARIHHEAASCEKNQTTAPPRGNRVGTHFVALAAIPSGDEKVKSGSSSSDRDDHVLVELDGRKAGPIQHGVTSPSTFLEDACGIVERIVSQEQQQHSKNGGNFAILALAKTVQEE